MYTFEPYRRVILELDYFNVHSNVIYMRGSRNFHERGSNENGNFLSQTRGVQPPKNPEMTFFKVKFSNSRGGGGGPDHRSPPPSGSAHDLF